MEAAVSQLLPLRVLFWLALAIFPAALLLYSSDNIQAADSDDDPHAKHRAMLEKKSEPATVASVKLLNSILLTQDGAPVYFVDDVINDRIVVIDFVYTTCTTVCPVLSAIFSQVQARLGERLGEDVRMVSVSVDPGRDTPERLKAYAESLRSGPDWVWLTGEKVAVDDVLRGLGAYTPDFADHPSMILVGDARSGVWNRFFGFPGPDQILAAVEELELARVVAATQQ